jgi:esterase/lipase superfamily enzyme
LLKATLVAFVAFALAGCASGPSSGLLRPVAAADPSRATLTVLAATTRAPAPRQEDGFVFSGERGQALAFQEFVIGIPPQRERGRLLVDPDHPDPNRAFTLIASRPLTSEAFSAALARRSPGSTGARRALVFVHGYNTRFDEAVFRGAQIALDLNVNAVPVLFSWPSRGELVDYPYDRDSAAFSRDAFERTLRLLAKDRAIVGIDIFAHSMGNWVTMETLRQLAIANDDAVRPKLGTVVMAAPDIDFDVFRTQVERIGPLKSKLVLYTSTDDRALALSQFLFGGKPRVGNSGDLEAFRALGVEAHDLSNVAASSGTRHNKAFGDPQTIASIGSIVAQRAGRQSLGQTLGGIITLPVRILGLTPAAN